MVLEFFWKFGLGVVEILSWVKQLNWLYYGSHFNAYGNRRSMRFISLRRIELFWLNIRLEFWSLYALVTPMMERNNRQNNCLRLIDTISRRAKCPTQIKILGEIFLENEIIQNNVTWFQITWSVFWVLFSFKYSNWPFDPF